MLLVFEGIIFFNLCFLNHRFVPGTENDKGVLFGVAIVRVQGPDEYVHAFPEYVTEKEIVAMQSLPDRKSVV